MPTSLVGTDGSGTCTGDSTGLVSSPSLSVLLSVAASVRSLVRSVHNNMYVGMGMEMIASVLQLIKMHPPQDLATPSGQRIVSSRRLRYQFD